MANQITNVSFSDYQAQQEDILRRREMARALQQQGMTPLGPTETIGGWAVKRSPWEGIGKMAQSMAGAYGQQQATEAQRALAEQQRAQQGAEVRSLVQALRGSPERPAMLDPQEVAQQADLGSPAPPNIPAQAPDQNRALEIALGAQTPMVQGAGGAMLAQMLKSPEWALGERFNETTGRKEKIMYNKANPTQVIPMGGQEAQNLHFADTGAGIQPLNPTTAAPVGQAIPKGLPPSEAMNPNKPFMVGPSGIVPNDPYQQFEMQRRAAGATRVQTNVSTEKKYGEQFAGQVAKADVDMRDAAIKAPELAARSNRIRELLSSTKVMTGTAADFRLQFSKAAKLVGLTASDSPENTEVLGAELASNTLDAIKASGLGGGTGFSNADRDFLEKAKGGRIVLQAGTISRLAELSHRAAQNSAERWNKRVKGIPKTALEGTGVDTSPIQVPPLFQGRQQPITPAQLREMRQLEQELGVSPIGR